jgi:hypothetical protein
MAETKLSLEEFARKKAITGAVVAGLLNAVLVHLSLKGTAAVPIFALVAVEWKKSLMGALIPRALLISLLVTIVTVWATVKSRRSGEVHPPLDKNVPWFRRTLILALKRAAYGFLLVMAIALVLRVLLPKYTTVPSGEVTLLVALFAGAMAFIMSYTAVMKAGKRE